MHPLGRREELVVSALCSATPASRFSFSYNSFVYSSAMCAAGRGDGFRQPSQQGEGEGELDVCEYFRDFLHADALTTKVNVILIRFRFTAARSTRRSRGWSRRTLVIPRRSVGATSRGALAKPQRTRRAGPAVLRSTHRKYFASVSSGRVYDG